MERKRTSSVENDVKKTTKGMADPLITAGKNYLGRTVYSAANRPGIKGELLRQIANLLASKGWFK